MITYLKSYVKARVPSKIIYLMREHPSQSLESVIYSKAIYRHLLTDMNLVSGKTTAMAISEDMIVATDNGRVYLELDKHARNGKIITQVSAVVEIPSRHIERIGDGTQLRELLDANKITSKTVVTDIQFHGDSVISLPESIFSDLNYKNLYLLCQVAFSKDLSDIDRRGYPEYGKIALMAMKMVAYNDLLLDIDDVTSNNTHVNSAILNRLEQYSSAELEYDEAMTKMAKLGNFSDKVFMSSIIRNAT